MLFLNIILFLTPFLFWYFFGFFINNIKFDINNHYHFILASICSGLSIYLTISKCGITNNIMLLFLSAIISESIFSYYINKFSFTERTKEINSKIFISVMIMFFINSIRIYKQYNSKIYIAAISLILHIVIILVKFINQ
jgi:hypothetical protein